MKKSNYLLGMTRNRKLVKVIRGRDGLFSLRQLRQIKRVPMSWQRYR